MAGTARPNIEKLKKETYFEFGSSSVPNTPDFEQTLFDGDISPSTGKGSLFLTSSNWVVFVVKTKCRLWGYSQSGIISNPVSLYTCNIDGSNSVLVQHSNQPVCDEWYVIFDELEPGIYNIQPKNYSSPDSSWNEWYIEDLSPQCLVSMNNAYYTIENNALKQITEPITWDIIENNGVNLSIFFDNLSLLSGKVKFISNVQHDTTVNTIKSYDELIVKSVSTILTPYEGIDFINTIASNEVTCVVSIDEGVTWKTYENDNFKDIDISIPLKNYSDFTPEETENWNNAINKIKTEGIQGVNIQNLDFNKLHPQRIMFAYVISIQNKTDGTKLKQTIIQCDEKSSFEKMNCSDIDISVQGNVISLIPHISVDNIKVNISPNGISTDTIDIDSLSDEQINKLKAKLGL